jgi:hypothetical protein
VFHFNKGHLADETIPMWVVKAHGVTFYVNHVTADIPWSTKETPGNEKTKGSIKFKKCKLSIDTENNTATISRLGIADAWLKHPERRAGRILFSYGGKMHRALSEGEFEHSRFKNVEGSCGSSFIICDLLDERELTFAGIKYATYFRILAANEHYYQAYDSDNTIWEQDEEELDE